MKMKLLVAAAAALVGTSAFAASFDGVNAQVGVGFGQLSNQTNSTSNFKNNNGGTSDVYNDSGSSSGKANIFGTASVGYSYSFANKFNLAANAFYLGGSSNAGSSSNSDVYTDGSVTSGNGNVTLKNIFGVSIEPGYYFADKTLGFVKLGWAQAQAGISGNNYDSTANPQNYSMSGTSNTQGGLYGFGVKQMLDDNIYLGFEAYQIQFANKTFSKSWNTASGNNINNSYTVKPTASFAGLTLGYKF